MDNIVGDKKIVYTWGINFVFDYNFRRNEMPKSNSHVFPQSGKYANKFLLTFDKKSDYWSFYLSGSSLNTQGTMDVCLFILGNNLENSTKRAIERKLTCSCNGNQLDKVGFPEFCSNEVLHQSSFNMIYINLGCEIIFRKQCVCSPTTNNLLYYRSMQNQFKQFLKSDELCDFTIVVDAQEIKVHRAILAARSPVFKTMLTIDMAEKKSNRLEIEDIDLKILKLMIHFIYTNEIDDKLDPNDELDLNEAEQLLIVADKYELEDLKDLCTNFMEKSLNIENITQHMLLAARYKNKSLMDAVNELMKSDSRAIDIACDGMLDQPFVERSLNIEKITHYMLLAAQYKSENLMDAVKKLLKNDPTTIDIACDGMLVQFSEIRSLNIENITEHMLLAARYKSKSLMDAVKELMKSDSKAIDFACDGLLKHF